MFKRIRSRVAFVKAGLRSAVRDVRLGFTMKPIIGADDGDPPPADPPADPPRTDPPADPPQDPPPANDPPPPADPPAGKALVDEGELNRLRRIASEKDQADREKKRKDAEEAGRHAEVVQSVEEERNTEKSEREKVEAEKADLELGMTVRDVANRLGFIDPADARLHLPSGTPNDPKEVERALKKVADEKKYLIGGPGSRTGAPGGGGDPTTPPDIDEQIRKAEADGDVALSTRLKRQKAFGPKAD